MTSQYNYIRDGAAIYDKSFAIIRAESDLVRFTPEEEKVAVRIIHSCGIVETAHDIFFAPGAAKAGREALLKGAPVLCDAKMVANGITRSRLPAENEIICTLDDPAVPELAKKLGRYMGQVEVVEELGADAFVYGKPVDKAVKFHNISDEGSQVIVRWDPKNPPRAGQNVTVTAKSDAVHLFDATTGNRVN